MVNFGPKATVPEKYKSRKLFEHNPTVTLMRTTTEECRQIGDFLVQKIKTKSKDPSKVEVRIPKGGVSMIATPGAAFADAAADEALFSTVTNGLRSSGVRIIQDDRDINHEGFAVDIGEQLMDLIGNSR